MAKSKGLAFFLSFVPGVGHYYLGLMQRGLQFNLLIFGLIMLCVIMSNGVLGFLFPVVWFYSLFDAMQMADQLKEKGSVEDRPLVPWHTVPIRARLIGWILILMGLYAFIMNSPGLKLFYALNLGRGEINNLLTSLALVAFGIYLLFGRRPGKDKENEDNPV